jgi:hypothetical protein
MPTGGSLARHCSGGTTDRAARGGCAPARCAASKPSTLSRVRGVRSPGRRGTRPAPAPAPPIAEGDPPEGRTAKPFPAAGAGQPVGAQVGHDSLVRHGLAPGHARFARTRLGTGRIQAARLARRKRAGQACDTLDHPSVALGGSPLSSVRTNAIDAAPTPGRPVTAVPARSLFRNDWHGGQRRATEGHGGGSCRSPGSHVAAAPPGHSCGAVRLLLMSGSSGNASRQVQAVRRV